MAEVVPNSRKRASNPNRGSKPGERRGGRQPGTPNKVTADIREALRQLLEQAAPKMVGWLERVATEDPAKALDLALKAAEYAVPKLSRTAVDIEGGGTKFIVVETGVPQSEFDLDGSHAEDHEPEFSAQYAHAREADPEFCQSLKRDDESPVRWSKPTEPLFPSRVRRVSDVDLEDL
ncbi:MAG: hypothetical protein QM581_06530 [Pseudomonas sp.]